ncbi:MAG: nucleotidyltransferase family protein [Clostridia bacterium]|jgi:D-glycero-alpha-D-manno-heptose 1-phosphate guanylyltransferase
MQALILAGGLGTRLRRVVNDCPKPMALVNGKPFLQYLIEKLVQQDIRHIVLCTGYLGEQIEEYFQDGSRFNCRISYSRERVSLGTSGALKLAEPFIEEDSFLLLNGDTFLELGYFHMYREHPKRKVDLTIAPVKKTEASRYGSIRIDRQNRVVEFKEKDGGDLTDYINGGVYILEKHLLNRITAGKKLSLELDIIPSMLEEQILIFGYKVRGHFIDIGLPETYIQFQRDMLGRC